MLSSMAPPLLVVVMGVSGCGKSTVAAGMAQRLELEMVDGDDLHCPESVAKMRAGIALDDSDRWPWLDRIGDYLAQGEQARCGRIVACSALKRAYRDRIRARAAGVTFVFLDGDAELIRRRMAQRVGHYMQPELLDSQLRTLEPPLVDEADVIHLDLSAPIDDLLDQAQAALSIQAQSLQTLHLTST